MASPDRRGLRVGLGIALATLCGLSSAQSDTMEIIPAAPRYQEPVFARIKPWYRCIYGAEVAMSGATITIRDVSLVDICYYPYDVELGRFPTGSYTVQWLTAGQPLTAEFTVGPPPPPASYPGTGPAVDYSGMWWNASESGWGLGIFQGPADQLFAVWFVYDAAGAPTWYTLEAGRWTTTNVYATYSGSIYRYTGPSFGSAFDPAKVVGSVVGAGTLTFRSSGSGRFDYTVIGASGSRLITRLPIE